MKTLVLVFHPHLEKSQVNRKLMDIANETGDVTVIDEYAEYPDFHINVEREQKLIESHDRIVLQFPFYWYRLPRIAQTMGGCGAAGRLGVWRWTRTGR